ncbi:40S ribosomal protein S10 isoform X1 [Salvelinus fontinalis]|uniref:40S ribosomal protein S10 isoform X1 n=1 Tax=Salvelinus fontinalis TaxID=8038 RepID=UPI0024860B60|nr:40S ribosomal protein S10 isoform X1 [Salvelinus fontinalis]
MLNNQGRFNFSPLRWIPHQYACVGLSGSGLKTRIKNVIQNPSRSIFSQCQPLGFLSSPYFEMLMPKKNRIAIYELLFKEGVMVAKKDVHLAKHPELADRNVPNLHVMKAMQSLKSTGYVKEQFAWRHFYWYLTNEGIQYLRDFLHLPPEIVPATLRRQMRPETARPRPKGMEGERGERPARFNREGGDRDNYRRSAAPPGADKKAEAGAGAATEFQFRGGFGRGRGQQPPQE